MSNLKTDSKTEALMQRLTSSNLAFSARFPGLKLQRQPAHTVYGGAHLYKPGAAQKISILAQKHFSQYAPDYNCLSEALKFSSTKLIPEEESLFASPTWIAKSVFDRVHQKLRSEAVEDHRADFEDGYGTRSDAEEDGHAVSAAKAMAAGVISGELPPFVGIRVKALSEAAKYRSFRTLKLFVETLAQEAKGKMPKSFTVTLPKVISAEQVEIICEYLDEIEQDNHLTNGSIHLELMIENVQCLFNAQGHIALPFFIAAGKGRVTSVVLGTFDYTASCNVASTYQSHIHPAADFARQIIISSLADSKVNFSDGITNIMPIPPHKGETLNAQQKTENLETVHAAWQLHFDNIMHSLRLGIYQGWDLNPAQIPIRFAAIYYFFLSGLADATTRLRTFIDHAAQASMVGNTFDDAATGQGLLNFFVNGISCGALTEEEGLNTGITLAELQGRSFQDIVENRISHSSKSNKDKP